MHDDLGRVRAGKPPLKIPPYRRTRRVERIRHGEEGIWITESGEHEHDVPRVMFWIGIGVAVVLVLAVIAELVAAPDTITMKVLHKLGQ